MYEYPKDDQKWRTWSLLRRLAVNNTLAWLCAGDFNEILDDFLRSKVEIFGEIIG